MLTAASGQAQMMRGAAGIVRSGVHAERIARKIGQQSRRAEQAAREAAAASRIRIKPSGIRIVPVPNPDNDDNRRKKGDRRAIAGPLTTRVRSMKPISGIKTFSDMLDESIAARYDSIKTLVRKGGYIWLPYNQFQLADYAMRHNDEQFAVDCLGHVQVDRVTPQFLELIGRCYPALGVFMPEISRAVAVSAYGKMLEAKLQSIDCYSARMQAGDTLLIVTDQYNPSLNPLVVLSCFYEPSLEVERYKEAADSVVATYNEWSAEFKDAFARDFIKTLMDKGEYASALDYFGSGALKQFPDTLADFALDLATCAMDSQNDSLFIYYLQQAIDLDSVKVKDYWTHLYDGNREKFIADPSQIELADWLIETAPTPAANALSLSADLWARYWHDGENSWEWWNLTPEQETVRQSILYILNKATDVDAGGSEPDVAPYIAYLKAEMLMPDPTTTASAKSMLDNLVATDEPDLRCSVIIGLAYIAGHGVDNPKEALKILKKDMKLLDNQYVSPGVRDMWFDYMATLATVIGKTKDAEKYRKLKMQPKTE